MQGRMIGIGPPPKPEPTKYTQEEYYCERCDKILKEETIYNTRVGLYICDKCKLEVQKESL